MYNKKVLSTAKKELTKAKAPKKSKDIITDPMGQWKYPGLPTRIPSNDITMKGVGYPVLGVANNGQRKIMLPGADYTFPGADYVDEYPQMRKGGAKKKKTKSLSGTNKLMLTHPLLQNYKNKVYDPNVNYFQDGGYIETELTDDEIEEYRKGGYIVEDISVPELTQAQKGISKSQKKSWESLGKQLKKPVIKIPKNAAEAQKMMDSDELDYESWQERKARNIKEAEERKQARLKSLKDYEKRVSNKKYNSLTGLPNEDWRELLANEAAPLGAKFRVSQEDNFFDDYLNPLAMIGSGAQSLGEAPKLAKESDSYIPYVSAIGSPLLTGALAGVGANNTKQFVNNLFNPLADAVSISDIAKSGVKKIKNARQARKLNKVLKNLKPIDYDNLIPNNIPRRLSGFEDDANSVVNTTEQASQLRPITDFTSNHLMRGDALEDIIIQWIRANDINEEVHMNDTYSRLQNLFRDYHINPLHGDIGEELEALPNDTFNKLRNDVFTIVQDVSPNAYNNIGDDIISNTNDISNNVRNRSYLTKKTILDKAKNSNKIKEQLDQLTPEQFEQTVYKPTGELIDYVPSDKLDRLQYVPNMGMIHKDAIPISTQEYADIFNNNLDKLNELIEDYNKSGVSYRVTELTPYGSIKFANPKQIYKKTPSAKQAIEINTLKDEINNINKSLENGLYNSETDITHMLSKKDYAEKRLKRFEKTLQDEEIPQGTSSFGLEIVPGQWRGEVEDIANSDYYKYLPGLNMNNTTGSVFADKVPRRGTGFYEALNEYLKKYDLGRVKPGFNGQTEYSEGLWNNAISKGKAHGFYGSSSALHGSFKKKGGIVAELSDDEIQDYINQGYIVEEVDEPEMQSGGQMPYQIWEEKTGTPWSEAKRQGLTDGSYEQNVALAQKLLADATSVIKENLESKPTFDYNKYDQIVSTLVQKGNTLEDLVAQQIGTKEGLMKRYPKLFSASNSKSKAVNTANIPVKNVDEILKKPTAPINLKVPQTKMKSETLQYQNVPFKKLNLISDSNLKPKPVSSTVKQFERSKKVNETKLKEAELKNYVNAIRESLTPDSVKKQKQLQNSFFPTASKKKLTVKEPLTQETTQEFRDRMMKIQQELNLKSIPTDTEKIKPIQNFQDLQGEPGKYKSTVNLPEVNGKEFPVKKPVVKVKPLQDITKIQNSFKPEMSFKKGSKLTEAKPETEQQVVKEDSGYKVISNLTNRISSYDQSLQNLYYDYTNPKHSPEKRKQVKAAFDNKLKERNNLITTINSKKRDYAGVLDSWIDESAPAWIKKPAQKGIFNVSLADQVEASSYKLPKFETYKEKEEKENEKFRTSKRFDDLGGNEKGSRWQFRVAASNDDPMKVQLYGTRSERNPNLNIKAKGAVMHFLDQSPLTGYVHPTTQAYYRDLKPDGFVGKLEKQKDGNYAVKYIPKKDIPAKDLYKNTFLVRQEKFDNIDFNTKVSDRNFLGHTYWTKKGSTKATIPISSGKDANVYDYASGQSVVFIFPYKGKTRYIHFAGSPNAIKKEGEEIKKLYKLQANKLVLGLADAGSYSSSIKGNITDKKLKDWSYGYANTNGFTGAGMALVD